MSSIDKSRCLILRHQRLLVLVMTVFCISTLLSCSSSKKTDPNLALFARSVESCVCNYLDIEDDYPTGLTYEDFIQDCNKTVRESHPSRFNKVEDSVPEMDSLRCPEKVESWLKVVEEQNQLHENNRKLIQDVLEQSEDDGRDTQVEEMKRTQEELR